MKIKLSRYFENTTKKPKKISEKSKKVKTIIKRKLFELRKQVLQALKTSGKMMSEQQQLDAAERERDRVCQNLSFVYQKKINKI